jgi:hypothetical protein
MNTIVRKLKSDYIHSIKLIWNEVIDEGESFFFDRTLFL